jgi:hypothetical protein
MKNREPALFETEYSSSAALLRCPSCGDAYGLHHTTVEVFSREEDAETGNHTTVYLNRTITDSSMEGNPSRRRDGIIIHLYCEHCEDADISLEIAQHKGVTLLQAVVGRE